MLSKIKKSLFVWGWDIKIFPFGSPFGITRQPLLSTVIIGQIFVSHPKIMLDSYILGEHTLCYIYEGGQRFIGNWSDVSKPIKFPPYGKWHVS